MAPFKVLTMCMDVQLEHLLVMWFYNSIVSDGNWAEAKHMLQLTVLWADGPYRAAVIPW